MSQPIRPIKRIPTADAYNQWAEVSASPVGSII